MLSLLSSQRQDQQQQCQQQQEVWVRQLLLFLLPLEEGSVNKIGASLKDYISEKGSWRMLNEYRNFLNEHTAWYRPSEPDKIFSWQQRIKVRIGGRDTYRGNKSIITGTSPTKRKRLKKINKRIVYFLS